MWIQELSQEGGNQDLEPFRTILAQCMENTCNWNGLFHLAGPLPVCHLFRVMCVSFEKISMSVMLFKLWGGACIQPSERLSRESWDRLYKPLGIRPQTDLSKYIHPKWTVFRVREGFSSIGPSPRERSQKQPWLFPTFMQKHFYNQRQCSHDLWAPHHTTQQACTLSPTPVYGTKPPRVTQYWPLWLERNELRVELCGALCAFSWNCRT